MLELKHSSLNIQRTAKITVPTQSFILSPITFCICVIFNVAKIVLRVGKDFGSRHPIFSDCLLWKREGKPWRAADSGNSVHFKRTFHYCYPFKEMCYFIPFNIFPVLPLHLRVWSAYAGLCENLQHGL